MKRLYGAAAAAHAKKSRKRKHNPRKKKRSSGTPVGGSALAKHTGYTVGKAPIRRHRRRGHALVHRRRRRNDGGSGLTAGASLSSTKTWEKIAILAAIGVAGGFAAMIVSDEVESKIAKPPLTLGLIEMGLGVGGLVAGIKAGVPAAGIGFASVIGASGARKVIAGLQGTAAAAPPADPAAAAAAAAAAGQMGAVYDTMGAVYDVGDLEGAEGLAAVEYAIDSDEEGNPIFDDEFNPYSGSGADWG